MHEMISLLGFFFFFYIKPQKNYHEMTKMHTQKSQIKSMFLKILFLKIVKHGLKYAFLSKSSF